MLDVGKLGYPEVQPWSPGPSIFDLAYEAQLRVEERHEREKESMEASGKPVAWSAQDYADIALIERCDQVLADPFRGHPDEYLPDVYHPGRK